MGIFKRIGTLLKSNINDMISRAEDPEKILNQLIIDMKESLIDARKQVAVAIADEKRLRKQLDTEIANAAEWEKKAMMAIQAGRDDLAKEALRRKSDHDNMVADYQKQWELQKNATDKLRQALRLLNNKIEEAKRKKDLLIARKKRAEAQKHIQETMTGISDTSAFDAFERMSEKIERQEAEAEAAAELADTGVGDVLHKQFEQLEVDHGVDGELAALKAKMGLAPKPAAAPAEVEEFDFSELEEAVTVPAGRPGGNQSNNLD
ncbi:MAG: PspA/IM30 family protein [Bradymonadales bacterium]|nr:PspA/IM30 family protein [Bradymonadales bacterium]